MTKRVFCPSCHHETNPKKCSECGAIPILHERFVLERMLGHGAQGFTWLAKPIKGGPHVAIKELSFRRLDTFKSLDLFKREVEVLKTLKHPAIPEYLEDFHIEDGRHVSVYLVQEFIEGTSLEISQTSQEDAVNLLKELLDVLTYLHSLSPPVIHRDIKPSNIMRRPDGSFVLIDFGSTRAVLESTMGGSTIAGTVGYMAPEQLIGQASPASDLYGLGATIVTLLSNQPVLNVIDSTNPGSWERKVKIDKGLQKILRTMLEPNPNKRAPNAQSVLEDVNAWEVGKDQAGTFLQKWVSFRTSDSSKALVPAPQNAPVVAHKPAFRIPSASPWHSLSEALEFACQNFLLAALLCVIFGLLFGVAIMLLLLLTGLLLWLLGIRTSEGSSLVGDSALEFIWTGIGGVSALAFLILLFAPWIYVGFRKWAQKKWAQYPPLPTEALPYLRFHRWCGVRFLLASMFLPHLWGWVFSAIAAILLVVFGHVIAFEILVPALDLPHEPLPFVWYSRIALVLFVLMRITAHTYIPASFFFSRRSLGAAGLSAAHKQVEEMIAEEPSSEKAFAIDRRTLPKDWIPADIETAESAVNLLAGLTQRKNRERNPTLRRKEFEQILSAPPTRRNARLLRLLSQQGSLDQGIELFRAARSIDQFLDSQPLLGPLSAGQVKLVSVTFIFFALLVAGSLAFP